ncbi:hypothetical protein [Pseudomonas phage D6]|nr:hypothetical protein [Pseudomonas phage D6]
METKLHHLFRVLPDEMTYHKDRFFVNEGAQVTMVKFVGAYHGENILTNEVDVIARGVELGKVARFLVRCGDQEADLVMDLVTCRYEADRNIKTKLGDVELLFDADFAIEQKEAA